MTPRRKRLLTAVTAGLALAGAGCGKGALPPAAPVDPVAQAAWMDGAVLQTQLDPCAGESLYLADPPSGNRLLLDVDETQRTATSCPP